ncbi:GNAT family N-acetyltransferase [Dysgonomonas sp. Marseille-P4677]|uniref:GNAT family N-acetyltransferase n=1 Tax=Dysgonomonas sp. Marseille-P4677 TaxID=2364790 RepID=UPI00191218A0|nr:GNAT family N-acetyltransferase [Dysgonomonas sp. Marseille-P4677]MBK5721998.1 GNAT family N-acetyltransferase [Dysgonomonas sp. Marseille-P4677]
MKIISVRENPEYKNQIIAYLQRSWSRVLPQLYSDCIDHCIDSPNPLPQWYILEKDGKFIGCAGLITNDFISRMDLYPWLAALFIDEEYRGNCYAQLLIEKIKSDAQKASFNKLYLSTDHIGFYEKYGWTYIGNGYHPWGDQSRIYEILL